jgi:adenylate kinase
MRDVQALSFDDAPPPGQAGQWRWTIALVGPPGSGKGTQAARLARALDLTVVPTGELARKAAREPTERGCALNAATCSGALVPDGIICELVDEAIREFPDSGRGVVFDGFPRTDCQARVLDGRILPMPLDAYVELRVDEEVLLERLGARNRGDDGDLTDLRRLDDFDHLTRPMIERLRSEGRVLTIDGGQPPANVHRAITESLGRYARRLVSSSSTR